MPEKDLCSWNVLINCCREMAAEAIAVGLQVALEELIKRTSKAMEKAEKYKENLMHLETTVTSVKPIVEQMRKLKEESGCTERDDQEMNKLNNLVEEGKKLVAKCSKGKRWYDCIKKKTDYTNQLVNLNQKFTIFCQIEMQIRQRLDLIETNRRLKNIERNQEQQRQEAQKNLKITLEHLKHNGSSASLRPYLPPDPPEVMVGLDRPLSELKEKVLKEGKSVVVLSAPGGCGKSTLAKKLCHDKQIKDKFRDNILFIIVSRTPNLQLIVQQLLLHKSYKAPEFQSNEHAIHHLEQLLKIIGQNPLLIILDDVWDGFEFFVEAFFKSELPDYKIVVTSRSTFPRFGSPIKLETLDENNSINLFRKSASLEDGNPQSITDNLVLQVVRACTGFPLALTVVGKSLQGQPVAVWKKRQREWSRGSAIFKDNMELLNCLKTSLDALDDKGTLKECYMDLGSFPEGQLIPAAALLDMWVELHELDENGTEVIGNLHELSNLNLLDIVITSKDTSEVDGYYNDHFVIQHGLLKKLVNHLSGLDPIDQRNRLMVEIVGNKFPNWWTEQKQPSTGANLISISTDESFSSKWCSMQAPAVKVLVLNFYTEHYELPELITNMNSLNTLLVTNYGSSPTKIKNLEFLGVLTILKRIRAEQVSVPSLTLGCAQLSSLQKIFFHRCDIGHSLDVSHVSSALPKLVEIDISYSTNLVELPIALCHIVHLKKLNITYCHQLALLPKEIGKLANLEALRLCSCTYLQGLPDTIGSLQKLFILDISDCVSITNFPNQIGELQNLRKIFMKGCPICKWPKSVANLVKLEVVSCDEAMPTLWESLKISKEAKDFKNNVKETRACGDGNRAGAKEEKGNAKESSSNARKNNAAEKKVQNMQDNGEYTEPKGNKPHPDAKETKKVVKESSSDANSTSVGVENVQDNEKEKKVMEESQPKVKKTHPSAKETKRTVEEISSDTSNTHAGMKNIWDNQEKSKDAQSNAKKTPGGAKEINSHVKESSSDSKNTHTEVRRAQDIQEKLEGAQPRTKETLVVKEATGNVKETGFGEKLQNISDKLENKHGVGQIEDDVKGNSFYAKEKHTERKDVEGKLEDTRQNGKDANYSKQGGRWFW